MLTFHISPTPLTTTTKVGRSKILNPHKQISLNFLWELTEWLHYTFFYLKLILYMSVHWKDWCWSWNSNTLATWYKELTHWKRPWCWERLKAGGERDDRGWDGLMASPTRWTWVWVNSGSWWRTGRPGVLQFMGLQRVGHDWMTELKWWPIHGEVWQITTKLCQAIILQ